PHVRMKATLSWWKIRGYPICCASPSLSRSDTIGLVYLPGWEHNAKSFVLGCRVIFPSQEVVTSKVGHINNYIILDRNDREVQDGNKVDFMESSKSCCHDTNSLSPGSFYLEELLVFHADSRAKRPPIKPPFLDQLSRNKDSGISRDRKIIPKPNHEEISDNLKLIIHDNVLDMSMSFRFKKIKVLFLLQEPI
uniref:Association with the SNF1 complex (ASC) domain-containing protein n=1 Tax=Pongo abelii TaxID=9601 RepID=A0A8I5THT7_PONAB